VIHCNNEVTEMINCDRPVTCVLIYDVDVRTWRY